ncbi:hypothetical protein DFP72DRAFT_855355 [Ephemerocybe angulata]|uniref:Uncharacterized protein n=1 Tax=Ephemerocybe angulata TaxID=980116 RepID=A0A8H6HHV7_9AGAR|nr:hypothetical protein DFP72DRAFT_855355 [Tulosesus angulatus]
MDLGDDDIHARALGLDERDLMEDEFGTLYRRFCLAIAMGKATARPYPKATRAPTRVVKEGKAPKASHVLKAALGADYANISKSGNAHSLKGGTLIQGCSTFQWEVPAHQAFLHERLFIRVKPKSTALVPKRANSCSSAPGFLLDPTLDTPHVPVPRISSTLKITTHWPSNYDPCSIELASTMDTTTTLLFQYCTLLNQSRTERREYRNRLGKQRTGVLVRTGGDTCARPSPKVDQGERELDWRAYVGTKRGEWCTGQHALREITRESSPLDSAAGVGCLSQIHPVWIVMQAGLLGRGRAVLTKAIGKHFVVESEALDGSSTSWRQ